MPFKSSLLRFAVSNVVKTEADRLYSKNERYPKSPEEKEALFNHLDELVPAKYQNVGAGKPIYQFLLRLLFKNPQPGFVLGEDDYKVTPLIKSYCKAVETDRLHGDEKNLARYQNLESLEEQLNTTLDKETSKAQRIS